MMSVLALPTSRPSDEEPKAWPKMHSPYPIERERPAASAKINGTPEDEDVNPRLGSPLCVDGG